MGVPAFAKKQILQTDENFINIWKITPHLRNRFR